MAAQSDPDVPAVRETRRLVYTGSRVDGTRWRALSFRSLDGRDTYRYVSGQSPRGCCLTAFADQVERLGPQTEVEVLAWWNTHNRAYWQWRSRHPVLEGLSPEGDSDFTEPKLVSASSQAPLPLGAS